MQFVNYQYVKIVYENILDPEMSSAQRRTLDTAFMVMEEECMRLEPDTYLAEGRLTHIDSRFVGTVTFMGNAYLSLNAIDLLGDSIQDDSDAAKSLQVIGLFLFCFIELK